MATLQMAQSVFGDLLAEVDLKPWWEKLRSYCVGVIITCCFIIAQISTIFYKVDCIPMNVTLDFDFSRATAIYISNICSYKLPEMLQYFRVTEVGLSGLLLVATSWWSLRPSVVSSFRSYRKVEDLLDEVLLTMEELDDANKMKEAMEDKKQRTKLDKIRRLAKGIETNENLRAIYILRNVLLMFWTALCVAGFACIWSLSTAECSFRCDLNNISIVEFEDVLKSLGGITNYSCSHDLARKLPPYYIIIISASVIQFLLVFIGTCKVCNCLTRRHDSDVKHRWIVGQFLEIFFQNARPIGKGHFREYAELLLSEKSTTRAVYYLHCTRNPKMLLKQLETQAESGSCMLDQDDLAEYVSDFTTNEDIRGELSSTLAKLVQAKEWELLVELLNKIEDVQEADIEALEKINLHEIGKPFGEGRSVLYYALRCNNGHIKTKAAQHLLKHSLDKRPYYVYDDLRDHSAPEFFKLQKMNACEKDRVRLSQITELLDSDNSGFKVSEKEAMLGEFAVIVQRICGGDDVSAEEENMAAEDISHRRFLVWSEEMKEIAKSLAEKQRWILFVELLNCYVGKTIENCGVTNFKTNKKNDVGPLQGNILYYALRKPEYRVRYGYLAARYILEGKKKDRFVWDETGRRFRADEFVDSNSGLEVDDKRLLRRLLNDHPSYPRGGTKDRRVSFESFDEVTRGGTENIPLMSPNITVESFA